MSAIITTVNQSLPYIDPEPTEAERATAESVLAAERAKVPDDPYHALLPPPHTPKYTPLVAAEIERVSSGSEQKPNPLNAIDFTRYEAIDPPTPADLAGLPDAAARKDALSKALSRAYTAHGYVRARRAHLALLDGELGRNAWLIGNVHLEGELRSVERELAEARREIDLVAVRRRAAQEEVAGEMASLEETWKRGVGRVLETEVAAELLRRQVLEATRTAA